MNKRQMAAAVTAVVIVLVAITRSSFGGPAGAAVARAAAKSQSNLRELTFEGKKVGKLTLGKRTVFELIGDAFVQTEDLRLDAGRITISLDEKSELIDIRATGGKVRMQMRSARLGSGPAAPAVVTCTQAVYQSSQRKVIMDGPVNVKMDAAEGAVVGGDLEGEKAEIDLDDPEGMRITIDRIRGKFFYRESPKSAVKNGETVNDGKASGSESNGKE
jgi:hypothetical protein